MRKRQGKVKPGGRFGRTKPSERCGIPGRVAGGAVAAQYERV
ncbi:hypothetical protein AGRO_1192 [Agrobacterium sp. ATCC 31749]|nr:hypothetical protein AGRO_1192 [Agrobacterium sp. ATCC 31749]